MTGGAQSSTRRIAVLCSRIRICSVHIEVLPTEWEVVKGHVWIWVKWKVDFFVIAHVAREHVVSGFGNWDHFGWGSRRRRLAVILVWSHNLSSTSDQFRILREMIDRQHTLLPKVTPICLLVPRKSALTRRAPVDLYVVEAGTQGRCLTRDGKDGCWSAVIWDRKIISTDTAWRMVNSYVSVKRRGYLGFESGLGWRG